MSIVLCVPFMYPHKKHIPHLMEWYAANKARHDLELHWEMGRPLHLVQANAVNFARTIGASHVLFTEHDHWAYPDNGLEVLLGAEREVIGFLTYMRKYPYLPMCMNKIDKAKSMIVEADDVYRNLQSFQPVSLMAPTDLITWAFTLVQVAVFDRMREANKDPFAHWGFCPTDSYFSQYCEDLGILRWIHAGAIINHGDIPREELVFHRRCYDSINAQRGHYGKGMLPYPPQNEDDPHGVAPYQSEAEKALEQSV